MSKYSEKKRDKIREIRLTIARTEYLWDVALLNHEYATSEEETEKWSREIRKLVAKRERLLDNLKEAGDA